MAGKWGKMNFFEFGQILVKIGKKDEFLSYFR